MAGNDAINVNPPNSLQDLTVRGSDFLWAVFAIMAFSDLAVFAWHLTVPRGQRVFHQLGMIVLTTAAIAYFSMASNLGGTPIAVEYQHANGFPVGSSRAIWYVRYIDWVITTPALLLTLLLATGLPLSDIITTIFFDIAMIITGLVGALVASSYKWGYFTFGMACEVYIWWILAGPARKSSTLLGGGYRKSFTISAVILSFLWLLYPIAWGLADGGNVITTDSEMIFYGILDVLAKPVFLITHIFLLSREDLSTLQLNSGKFTGTSGVFDREKGGYAASGSMPGSSGIRTGDVASVGVNNTGKRGFFGRKGKYDQPTNVTAHDNTFPPPRMSEATAVSHQ